MSAERGHRVSLFERDTSLGGAVRIAAASPHRATLIDIVDYLERETRRLKVDVNLGAPISLDDLEEISGIADHVVLATGSKVAPLPAGPAVPRRGRPSTRFSPTPAPRSPALPWCTTRPTVSGPPTAPPRLSPQRGWQVTFATALTALAPRVPAESIGPLLQRLGDAGVTMHVAHRLVVPEDPADPVALRPVFGGGDLVLEPTLLVWHQPRIGDDELQRGTPAGNKLTTIGDCVTPRRIGHAIAEGYRVGANV